MKIDYCKQRTPEWHMLKKGKIGGTRFGQVISGRKNRLIYELLDETLSELPKMDEYISDDMIFGIENEGEAARLYSEQTGIEFIEVGAILSDTCPIHIASPDRVNLEHGIVLEIKCTMNGAIQLERFFEGPETSHKPQNINYFAVSDDVKQVHWVSFCPFRPEKKLVAFVFNRADYEKEITAGREAVRKIEADLNDKLKTVIF